jgi:hypothetical protein
MTLDQGAASSPMTSTHGSRTASPDEDCDGQWKTTNTIERPSATTIAAER